ncbi:hypothetical protein [Deinococcus humi]|uniref:Uncharacterized protein n=1 Tax=Deinococcus humi TaxID=662880 RepID=A0A7W8JZP7_9DEIO|nr:hypothetical protein [Deinococcus humi]MBB5365965.1 hypothetical protein [Deinococcus humi]GGO41741.1 hypothetical protein GCM10008949_52930 [Deinococcus humi]
MLIGEAQELLTGPFDTGELFALAMTAVKAAQELKGIISGKQSAQVAQIVLVVAARAALPDMVEPWIIPLLEGPAVAAFIESAFQKAFAPEVAPCPHCLCPTRARRRCRSPMTAPCLLEARHEAAAAVLRAAAERLYHAAPAAPPSLPSLTRAARP